MNKNPTFNLTGGLIIFLSLFLGGIVLFYNFRVISVETPQEFRENAILLTTNLLLDGQNPYSLKNMPTYVNVYGILYNLVVLPFAKIFGSTFLLHRLISLVFITASCILLYKALRDEQVQKWLTLVPVALLYTQMVVGGSDLLARPDSLGVFLFFFTIFIAQKLNYNFLGLALALLSSILGFLDKPYFVLGLPYVILYLFIFKSKLKALLLLTVSVFVYSFTFVVIHHFFETYFLNTIFINYQVAGKDVNFLILQFITYFKWNFGIILALLLTQAIIFRDNLANFIKSAPLKRINLLSLNKPFLDFNFSIYTLSLLLSLLLIIFNLGLHNGNFMTYFTHLITFPLFIITVKGISQERGREKMFLSLLIIINLVFWSKQMISAHLDFNPDSKNEIYWSQVISKYHNVYANALFANILYDQNKPIYDNGQSEYFVNALSLNRKINLVKNADNQYLDHVQYIKSQIEQRKFDLVLIARDVKPFGSPYFTKEELIKNYSPIKFANYTMYNGNWVIGLWVPRN